MLIIRLLIALLPVWAIKRFLLVHLFGFKIHESAYIGFSYFYPRSLYMGPSSRVGHFNVCKGLSTVWMGPCSSISNLNWISGFPSNSSSLHFQSQHYRSPRLVLGPHSAITSRHILDCTDEIVIGKFSTIAGYRSQLLTHSLNIPLSKQIAKPIRVGAYCFLGTSVILLPGVSIPSFSVLGASSLVNKSFTDTFFLYGGVPARPLKKLDPSHKYFRRHNGFVY